MLRVIKPCAHERSCIKNERVNGISNVILFLVILDVWHCSLDLFWR